MLIVKEPVVYCDVDDTLVSWERAQFPSENAVCFIDPATSENLWLEVIPETIEALKLHAIRGHSIIVWSAGGAEWARTVVSQLGLTDMVHACLAKPTWYLDDLPASEFMPNDIRRDLRKKP